MDLTPYITSLREDLTTAASAGDEQTRRVAAVLSAALEPSMRLAIMNALADLAAEVTASLDDQVVEVRLDGKDIQVVVTGSAHDKADPHEEPAGASSTPPPPPPPEGGDISRLTLRLFEEIKSKAEQAASAQGVSLNTFVQQAVQSALHGAQSGRGGNPWGGRDWSGQSGRRDKGSGGSSKLHGWVQG